MSSEVNVRNPVNLSIVKVTDEDCKRLGQVKNGQIFNNMNVFHPEGLFSSEVFGGVGSEYRNRTFGYIDLGVTVLHPLVFKTICSLKAYYRKIIEGQITAIFDAKTGEFVRSNDTQASTGLSFFMKHVTQLKFERNDSDTRNFNIDLFNKSIKEDSYATNYFLVLPAGMRDYTVDPSGKPQEDEINTYYRKILAQASIVDPGAYKKAPEVYDSVAAGIQRLVLDLYEYIMTLLDGKNKLILGKWVSRKIFNSTRNVISSYIERSNHIDDKRRLGFNEVLVGLHQFAGASAPKSLYEIKNKYIRDIFAENSTSAFLVNAKTLKREEVLNTHIQKEYDLWTSSEGLEKVIASLGNLHIRDLPITLNKGKHYLALLYKDQKHFKLFHDIDDLPEGFSRELVKPVTLTQFIYMSLYQMDGQYPGLATRYPITGYGSIYPAMVKVTTTTNTDVLEELNESWLPTGQKAYGFPVEGAQHFNTMVVHHAHLSALGGDYDGDALSLTMVLSDEAIAEIKRHLNRREYYISDSGGFIFSSDTDTLNALMGYLTSD